MVGDEGERTESKIQVDRNPDVERRFALARAMESSTATPEEVRKARARRTSRTKERQRTQSQTSNITKPLPKTPPASPPTDLQQTPLPPEIPAASYVPLIPSPPTEARVPTSSRTPKVAASNSGHGHARSVSSSKPLIIPPGSAMDARRLHGVSAVEPANSRRTPSLDNQHGRAGSSAGQHSRAPSSDVEGRGVAAALARTRGTSSDHGHRRGASSSVQHSRAPSSEGGERRMGGGPPRTRGPSLDYQSGRPSMDKSETPMSLSFENTDKPHVGARSSIKPVRPKQAPAELEGARARTPGSRNPSLDRGTRRPDVAIGANPAGIRPSFEADIRRPGVTGADINNLRTPTPDIERRRAGASASDSGHANLAVSQGRRGPQGNPVRFNSTPTNLPINYRGYTPVPVTNMDDEEHAHVQETSTRLSHEKTLEDMPSFLPSEGYFHKDAEDPRSQEFNRDMRRRRLRVLAISCVIIALLIVTIVLLVVIVRPKILAAHSSIGNGSPDGSSLNQEQATCLADFRTNAPSNPAAYACAGCLPSLLAVTQLFLESESNAQDARDIRAAREFCGLQAIFNSTTPNQASLTGLGWLKDAQPCTWGGIGCDSSGAVTALNMTFPAVPQTLPTQMSALTSLSSLMITGDRSIPFGPLIAGLTSSLRSLKLYNTHLEGLAAADSSWFQQNGPLSGLTELIMDGNPSLGTSLPAGLFGLPLQTLVARNQVLGMPLDGLGNSASLSNSLINLDLALNNLTGTLPTFNLPHLTKLDLSNNNLLLIPPNYAFPTSLITLYIQNNDALNGTLPTALCTDHPVVDCNFQNTAFSRLNVTCGTCRF